MTYRIKPEEKMDRRTIMTHNHETFMKKVRKVAKKTKSRIVRATYEDDGTLVIELQAA